MSSKVFKTLAVAGLMIGATLLIGPAAGVIKGALMIGSAAATAIATVGLTAGAGLLGKVLGLNKRPAAPADQERRLTVSFNSREPRKAWLGPTAGGTDVRYQAYTDDQVYLHWIVVVAAHVVEAIDEIWFDTKKAWTSSGGVEADFSGYLQIDIRNPGDSGNGIAIDGIWTADCTLTGCAYFRARFKLTGNDKKAESPFAQSVPTRWTVRGKGAKLPDLRESGCEVDDQDTWDWFDDDSGGSPAFQLLFWLTGWRINGVVSVGRGIPAARLDLGSFVAAANACDEPVALSVGGSEARYRAAGIASEGENPKSVIDNLLMSMNAVLRDNGGRIALHVLANDLDDPDIIELTDDDIVGNESWRPTPSIEQFPNVVTGDYVDPSDESLYQPAPYDPEWTIALDSVDGIDRIEPFDVGYVQSSGQAQRLAKQRLQRLQYPGVYSLDVGARGWAVVLGKPVKVTHRGLGWELKLFRCVGQGLRQDGIVSLVLQEEHPDIYAWDEEDSPPVVAAAPSDYDPVLSPMVRAIAAANRSIGYGPPEITVQYDYAGDPIDGQLPMSVTYRLYESGVSVSTGIDWEWRVLSGTVNGLDLSDGWQTLSGSGAVEFEIDGTDGLGSDKAWVELKAELDGWPTLFTVKLNKAIAAAPGSGGGSGGGGGAGTLLASKASGFAMITSTGWVDLTGWMDGTLPTGITDADVSATLSFNPEGGSTGSWNVETKVVRNISGTPTDIGTVTNSNPDPKVIEDPEEPGTFVPSNGTANVAVSDTGMTAASAQQWRLMGRLSSGSRTIYVNGSVAIHAA